MTDTALIKPATTSDIPALRQMLQAMSDHDGGTYQVGSEQALQDALAKGLIHALIHPHGMVIYYPDFSTHRGRPGLYIQDLYVAPPARGTGLARSLVAATLRHQHWDARYICLGVSPTNTQATRFYTKCGFTFRGYAMMILETPALESLP
jgi:ribosomal protein S18 acetylase RimI-like enzyme